MIYFCGIESNYLHPLVMAAYKNSQILSYDKRSKTKNHVKKKISSLVSITKTQQIPLFSLLQFVVVSKVWQRGNKNHKSASNKTLIWSIHEYGTNYLNLCLWSLIWLPAWGGIELCKTRTKEKSGNFSSVISEAAEMSWGGWLYHPYLEVQTFSEILDRVASQSRRSLGLYLLGVHPIWDELATIDVDCHEIHTTVCPTEVAGCSEPAFPPDRSPPQ